MKILKSVVIVGVATLSVFGASTIFAGRDGAQMQMSQQLIEKKRQAEGEQAKLEKCYAQHGHLMPKTAAAPSSDPSLVRSDPAPLSFSGRDAAHAATLARLKRQSRLAAQEQEKLQLCWTAHGSLMNPVN